jgi:glucosylceramidase
LAAVVVAVAVVAVEHAGSSKSQDPASRRPMQPTVEEVLTSANLSEALTRLPDLHFGARPESNVPVIHVDERTIYQRVGGFGAAMTDTSAWLIHDQLAPGDSSALVDELFGSDGLRLNFIRVPIGASDFTADRRPYSYDDLPRGQSDPQLTRFSIAHDKAYIIPVLRQALAENPRATVFASLWSAPAWMKQNDALDDRRNLGVLLPSMYTALADYFVKFIDAYQSNGIPIAAITAQNEPGNPTPYPGGELPEPLETQFVTSNLMPVLRAAHLDPKIYGYDYGWQSASMQYAQQLASSHSASVFAGIASHCYFGAPTQMATLHQLNPRLQEMVSECSPGITPYPTAELLISSLRNWASTVALWNFALDPTGGPVQPPNQGCTFCSGLVTINEATHKVTMTRDYYQLGQVSEFVQPGAVRIASENFVHYQYVGRGHNIATPGLDDVAFLNPDGSKVLIAYDNSAARMRFGVEWRGRSFTYTIAPQAMTTFIWR